MKNALKIKEKNPETDVFILNRDIRTYGYHEADYRKAREAGVKFIRFSEDHKPEIASHKWAHRMAVEDACLNATLNIDCDAVVLSAATVPHAGQRELATEAQDTHDPGWLLP